MRNITSEEIGERFKRIIQKGEGKLFLEYFHLAQKEGSEEQLRGMAGMEMLGFNLEKCRAWIKAMRSRRQPCKA